MAAAASTVSGAAAMSVMPRNFPASWIVRRWNSRRFSRQNHTAVRSALIERRCQSSLKKRRSRSLQACHSRGKFVSNTA